MRLITGLKAPLYFRASALTNSDFKILIAAPLREKKNFKWGYPHFGSATVLGVKCVAAGPR